MAVWHPSRPGAGAPRASSGAGAGLARRAGVRWAPCFSQLLMYTLQAGMTRCVWLLQARADLGCALCQLSIDLQVVRKFNVAHWSWVRSLQSMSSCSFPSLPQLLQPERRALHTPSAHWAADSFTPVQPCLQPGRRGPHAPSARHTADVLLSSIPAYFVSCIPFSCSWREGLCVRLPGAGRQAGHERRGAGAGREGDLFSIFCTSEKWKLLTVVCWTAC